MNIRRFQKKDPRLLTTSVFTMIKSDDTTISTDIIIKLGGGKENPIANGNCHKCDFHEKMTDESVFRKHKQIHR